MERYWKIEKMNLKYHIPLHVFVCVLMLCVSPLLMGVENLSAVDTAKVLERYVALIGIIMLVPVFLPEQDMGIRELVYAKYTKSAEVYLIRLFGNIFILAVFLGAYIFMLKSNQCGFPAVKYYLGTFAEMVFFGGIGLFFYGLSDNLVIGYMASIVYYIMAVGSGKKYLKILYPFSMSMESYTEKICLIVTAAGMIAGGIYFRCRRKKEAGILYHLKNLKN